MRSIYSVILSLFAFLHPIYSFFYILRFTYYILTTFCPLYIPLSRVPPPPLPPVCSAVRASVLRGVVVPAGHGSGGDHPHPRAGLHSAAARTQQQVQSLWDRCVFPADM